MKRFFLWFALLNKRLARRVSFWLILAAVPLLVLALGLLAEQDSGVATVAIYCADKTDPAAAAALQRLTGQKSVLRCVLCTSEREARSLVASSRADAAWILPEALSERIDAYATGGEEPVVRIYTREENGVLQSLTRERLYAALYPELAYSVYSHYILDTLKPRTAPTEAELDTYYHSVAHDDGVIQFSTVDGAAADDASYLVMPVRGLLALLVMMAALASALYYLHDMRSDSFVWLSRRRKRLLPYGCHLIPTLDTAVVMVAALFLAGLGTTWYRELALMALYTLACVGFAELMRQLLGDTARLGVAIPILVLAMLALSPIFFDLHGLRALQLLFPPFYYLNGVHEPMYLALLAGYALAAFALSYTLGRVRERFEKE